MDAAAKQQIVERVKQATNVLVTVSANPSVDQLAACIGLTLLLNKMQKHATAVFSGKVPSTIEFLQPEKTIETNTNSLQDFIISLDKSKADKLRYKVEDQVVRIFITPYRTSINEKDLVFSQGDFNVEVVMALGIKDRSQIDQAIAAHGRILHDATVISVNAGPGTAPQLGQINWQEATASSLCEMLVSISEAFGTGLIDNQMATAFLTGIVAETERFSNKRTSPKVMTMAAQLMAAGANQQLIVSELEPPPPPPPKTPAIPPPLEVRKQPTTTPKPAKKEDGALKIAHNQPKETAPEEEPTPNEIRIDKQGNIINPNKANADSIRGLAEASTPPPEEATPEPPPLPPPPTPPVPSEAINTHALLNPTIPSASSPFSASMQTDEWANPMDYPQSSQKGVFQRTQNVAPPTAAEPPGPTAYAETEPGIDSARSAVEKALAAAPFDAATQGPIASLNAQPIGPELHTPEGTPSLNLPTSTNGAISASEPPPPEANDMQAPAPPPVPPPLPLNSNPGAMLPGAPPDPQTPTRS